MRGRGPSAPRKSQLRLKGGTTADLKQRFDDHTLELAPTWTVESGHFCRWCGETKPIHQFFDNRKNYLRKTCDNCRAQRSAAKGKDHRFREKLDSRVQAKRVRERP